MCKYQTDRCRERERKHGCTFRPFVLDACASPSVRSTMYSMKCMFCKEALPEGSSSRKQFCNDSHRTKYWREHSARSPKRKRAKDENGAKARVGVSREDRRSARKPQPARALKHTSAHAVPRVPMADQLSGLAPEGAVGYRLVLPARTADDAPRLSPPLDATGYQGHYSLRPFQAPYDIRLIDGQTYRVVWIRESGEIIAPKPDGTIPGLHYFLTSSAAAFGIEAESATTSILEAIPFAHNLTETERLTKALATALPALQELLTCLTTLAARQSTPEKTVAEESISPTEEESASPTESVASPQSIAAPESPLQNEDAADGIGGPPKSTLENTPRDPPPQAEAPQHWDAHPISEEERQWVIRWALDEEKVTLLFRELLRRTEGVDSRDPSNDTTYVPKAEDIKELAMIEGNFAIAVATVDLHKALLRAPLANPTGEYQQPNHIPSLGDFEKQRVLSAFRSMEQRAHFEYLLNRRDAVRMGGALPPQPKWTSGFNREARRKLEKIFQDTRATALMAALLQQEWTAAEKSVRKDSVLPPSLLGLSRS